MKEYIHDINYTSQLVGPHSSYHINQPPQDTVNTYTILRRGYAAQSVINESSLEIITEYTDNAQVAHNIKLF